MNRCISLDKWNFDSMFVEGLPCRISGVTSVEKRIDTTPPPQPPLEEKCASVTTTTTTVRPPVVDGYGSWQVELRLVVYHIGLAINLVPVS